MKKTLKSILKAKMNITSLLTHFCLTTLNIYLFYECVFKNILSPRLNLKRCNTTKIMMIIILIIVSVIVMAP